MIKTMTALGEDIPAKYTAEAAITSNSRTIADGSVRVKPGLHMTYDPDDAVLDHTKVTA